MRWKQRHSYGVVLLALFALPVVRPAGFPSLEGGVDRMLGYTARFEFANPHLWPHLGRTGRGDGDGDGPRARALEQILLSEREEHARVLDEVAQRGALGEVLTGFARLPRALTARVLRAHDASAGRRSVSIDRGADDGVEAGQAVTQGRVLVGWVQHVGSRASRVQLVSDPHARLEVAVRTREGARASAWLRGGTDADLPLRNLRASADLVVRPGDPVVSGCSDGLVPAGLLVGTVSSASDDDGDGVLDVRVRLLLDLSSSPTVLVLSPDG